MLMQNPRKVRHSSVILIDKNPSKMISLHAPLSSETDLF